MDTLSSLTSLNLLTLREDLLALVTPTDTRERALSVEGRNARLTRGGRLEVERGVTRGAVDEGDGREGVMGDGGNGWPLAGDCGDGLPLIGNGGDGVPFIGGGTTRESTGS